MAFITELLGFIGLDVDDESFKKAEEEVAAVADVMGGMITVAGAMATAVAGAAFAMVNSFADSAVEIDRISKRLNVAAEAFQATAYAAKTFGIEQDQLADGMKELSMRAGEFALTGEGSFKDVAAQLGLSQAQVKGFGNDVNGLFNLVRDKLANVQNQGQRQFLTDALFGGGLADVGGEFFAQTSSNIAVLQKQAEESGIVISKENIDMAREYTREMGSLQARVKGLWNIVASNLLPIFTRVTKAVKEFLDLHGDDIVDGLTFAIKGLIEAVKYLGIAAAIAMPYLIGSAAIAGWAKLITLVKTVTTSFTVMRMAALLAWAAAAAGPVLVGLAIAGLILAIQDIYTYFTGGDSVTGRIIEAFGKPMVDKIKTAWSDLKAWFKVWIADVGKWFTDLIPDWLKDPAIKGRMEMIQSGQGDPNTKQSSFLVPGDMPSGSVIAPPTMVQGMTQANGGTNRSVNNSGNTTIGDINVTTTQNGTEFANQFRSEMMRTNASTVKNLNAGVSY